MQLIRQNMTVKEDRIIVSYPVVKDPKVLTDNRTQAKIMQGGLEKKLIKSDQIAAYNKCFQ